MWQIKPFQQLSVAFPTAKIISICLVSSYTAWSQMQQAERNSDEVLCISTQLKVEPTTCTIKFNLYTITAPHYKVIYYWHKIQTKTIKRYLLDVSRTMLLGLTSQLSLLSAFTHVLLAFSLQLNNISRESNIQIYVYSNIHHHCKCVRHNRIHPITYLSYLEVITRLFSYQPIYQARPSITAQGIAQGSCRTKAWYRANKKTAVW